MIVRTGFIPPLLTCTDPSAMKKLGKSQTRAHLSVTDCFGSLPIRHDPLWCCPPWCQPLRMTESKDEGRTWGVTKPDGMDQPAARCQVRTLASGNWIFVKHLSPPDSYNDNKRIGQIAYLSRDEGKTWEGGLVLDARKSVTYPDVEQGPDGLIYVTHDFERGRERSHVDAAPIRRAVHEIARDGDQVGVAFIDQSHHAGGPVRTRGGADVHVRQANMGRSGSRPDRPSLRGSSPASSRRRTASPSRTSCGRCR